MGSFGNGSGPTWTREELSRRRFVQRMASVGAWGFTGLAGAQLLAACGGSDADDAGNSTTGSAGGPTGSTSQAGRFALVDYSGGGTGAALAELRAAMEAPSTVVPGFAFSAPDTFVARLAWSSLYALDNQGQPVLADAKSYTPNDDYTVHTLELHPDLKWSDGTPYGADEYVFSLTYKMGTGSVFNPPWIAGLYEILFAGADISELGVEATDAHTLVITTNQSVPFLPVYLASAVEIAPIPRHVFEGADDYAAVLAEMTDPAKFVSNGPYVITGYSPAEITFGRNANYREGAPAATADTVRATIFDSVRSGQSFNAFRSGDLDVVSVGWNDIPAVKSDGALSARTTEIVWPNWTMLIVNHAKPPLDDLNVRKALYLAIDRELIASASLYGAAAAQHGLLSPGYAGYDAAFQPFAASDPAAEARSLLAAAGFENGEGFPTLTYITYGDASGDLISQAIVGMWKEVLGITVETQRLDPGAWYAAVITPDDPTAWGDIADGPWPAAYRDPADVFNDLLLNGGPVYHHNWMMPDEMVVQMDEALYEIDPTARATKVAAVNNDVMQQLPVIPTVLLHDVQVRGEGIEGQYAAYGSEFYGTRYMSA